MYLCRNVAQMSLPQIGKDFGKRDHTTVMHACTKIENEIKKLNINFDENISELQAIYFAIQNFDSSCKYRPYVYPLFNKFFNFRDELNAVLVGCVVYIIEKIKLGQLPVKTEKIIFTKQKLKQIEKLNQFLETIEEKAYNLAKIENRRALEKLQNKENNIDDYELLNILDKINK